MQRILHIITGLNTGGTEMMLCKLIENSEMEHHVLSLKTGGTLRGRIENAAAAVHDLDLKMGIQEFFSGHGRLKEIIRHIKPTHVQGWTYHGNIAASLAARALKPRPKLLWTIEHSLDDIRKEKWSTRVMIYLGKLFSKSPDIIVYTSTLSAKQHENYGYNKAATKFIPNGFNVESFCPDPSQKDWVQAEFKIPKLRRIITHIARYHPMKDHKTAIAAFGVLRQTLTDVHLLLVGCDVTPDNPAINAAIMDAKCEGYITCAGEQSDITKIWQGSDVAILSSAWGEGFPNVLGEAMACGVPCVTTDVGDAAWVVGTVGNVIQPGNIIELSTAIETILTLSNKDYQVIAKQARDRIVTNFSLTKIIGLYEGCYT